MRVDIQNIAQVCCLGVIVGSSAIAGNKPCAVTFAFQLWLNILKGCPHDMFACGWHFIRQIVVYVIFQYPYLAGIAWIFEPGGRKCGQLLRKRIVQIIFAVNMNFSFKFGLIWLVIINQGIRTINMLDAFRVI